MKHFGDITKISGYEVPIVDCVIGGSPCQDLSVAGKRAGLAGERSGLYMEQIRIIKEMREHDRQLRPGTDESVRRPRWMVWENVPGAFSSGDPKGADFAAVIEEAIKVKVPDCPHVDVPDGGWPLAGCFFDERGHWSVAWRTHDAQHWGVPQRRKRISMAVSFNDLSAPQVLFDQCLGGESASEVSAESEGMHRDFAESGEAWQGTAAGTEGSTDPTEQTRQENSVVNPFPCTLQNGTQSSSSTIRVGQ